MDLNKISIELPEISAKDYAKLNNFELSHIFANQLDKVLSEFNKIREIENV